MAVHFDYKSTDTVKNVFLKILAVELYECREGEPWEDFWDSLTSDQKKEISILANRLKAEAKKRIEGKVICQI